MNNETVAPSKWTRRLSKTALFLLVITLLALVVAGPGYRAGIIGLTPALLVLVGSAAGGLLCLVIGAIATFLNLRKGTQGLLAVSVLSGLVGLGLTLNNASWFSKARGVPGIHDITTDMVNPPEFVDIAPLRADAPNPVGYEGGEVSEKQRDAYPDIVTIVIDQNANEVFNRAAAAAEQMGWEMVAANADEGRIEATATTGYFGFKDDVVIRIRADGNSSAVDVRSKSRVGVGDVGANADRIRAFREHLLENG